MARAFAEPLMYQLMSGHRTRAVKLFKYRVLLYQKYTKIQLNLPIWA